MNQTSIFDLMYDKYKITKPIRLIEFFAGYGSQALALKYLGVPFEHWKICEWAVKSIQAYKDIHFPNDNNNYFSQQPFGDDWLISWLYEKGISSNYNEPMSKDSIVRLGQDQRIKIYNNICATNNLVNIQQVKGKDLEMVDNDKYDYIWTYSFPCQDLSNAGLKKGFNDTSTRSGMLWEVERILEECDKLGTKPRILLMENVIQVHSPGENLENFHKWQLKLEEFGYKNYMQDLIATDYGIPQTRNRCFMVSILGDYSYTFPQAIPLDKKLKDLLEDNVDKKFYLSDKQIEDVQNWNAYEKPLENMEKTDKLNISPTLTTRSGAYASGMVLVKDENMKSKLCNELIESGKVKENDVIRHSYTTSRLNGDMKDLKQNNLSPTLDTRCDCLGVCVGTYQYAKSDNFMQGKDRLQLGKDVSDTLQTTQKEGVVILGNYSPSNHNASRIVDREHCSPTVMENHGTITATQTNDLRIRKLTPRECFRLMGVKDEDFERCAKNQSNASLYHLAGDSIVVDVLCHIFKQFF